jgi:hypothetical protein
LAGDVPKNFDVVFLKPLPVRGVSSRWLGQEKGGHNMADQSLDARRIAREQEGRMAASASIGFNAVKPFIQFQISMMRVFAENIDQVARNYEKSFETVSNVITQQGSESRHEAA